MSTELTSRYIEKLGPKEKRYNAIDSRVRGLGVAVYPSGQKTFFHVRKIQGRPERTTLGTFGEMSLERARGKAEELNGRLSKWKSNDFEGTNPLRRPKDDLTLESLLDDYCERGLARSPRCRKPARAAADAKYNFNKYLAVWRERKLGQVSRADVVDLHQELRKSSGPYSANRVVQLLKAMYNWALHPDSGLWVGANPVAKVALFQETKRERFIADENELARLFSALKRKETSTDLRDAVNLLLWTGARKSDVLAMSWSDLKIEDNRWDVPDSKSGSYALPLTPEAIAILKTRLRSRKENNAWVFPSRGETGHIVELKGCWSKLLKRAKISNLRLHDLRRTLGSWQAKMGSSLLVIGKSLGHKSLDATEIYSRLDLDAVRESMTSATAALFAASKKKLPLARTAHG